MRYPGVLASVLALLLVAQSSLALSKSEAGKIDWHIPRLGVPHVSNTSATPYLTPRFHRILRPDADNKDKAQTAIFVATESNAVGALNPRNGAIVWRQVFQADDQVLLQKQFGQVALAVSGNGGANIRLFHAFTGFLIWETQQHAPRDGLLPESGVPSADATFLRTDSDPAADVVTIANGHTVRRLDGSYGREVWRWEPQDDLSRRSLIRVVANKEKVYVVSLARNTGSGLNSISVSTLSAISGELLETRDIPSGVKSAADVIILPWARLPNLPPTANPGAWVAWLNKDGTVRAAPLDPPNKRLAQPQVIYSKRAEFPFTALVDTGLGDKGLFVARRSDGLAEVLRLSVDAKFTSFWEFEEDAYDAVYSGTYDRSGKAYLQRIFFQRAQHLMNFHFLWADANNGGEGQVSGFSFQWDHDMHGNVLGASFETSPVGQYQLATRTMLVTSSGSARMLLDDKHQWILEEGLSQTTHAVMVDLPERKLTALDGGPASLDHEGFVRRLVRHTVSLRDLPEYIVAFGKRFVTGSYGSLEQYGLTSNSSSKASTVAATTMVKEGKKPAKKAVDPVEKPTSLAPRIAPSNTTSHLFRDPFGFRKLVVVATSKGKLYALDTIANDAVVWEKSLVGYGDGEGDFEPKVEVKLIQTVRDLSTYGKSPLLAVVAQVELQPGLVNTRVFQLNPLTGEFLHDALSGQTIFLGKCVDAFLLPASVEDPSEKQQALGLIDSKNQLHLYPDTLAVAERFAPISEHFFFSLRQPSSSGAGATFAGYTIEKGVSSMHRSRQVWSLPLPAGEEVVQVLEAPSRDIVASLGRVLGDRSTLYKYLNPHAQVVTTVSHNLNQAHVYLVDTVTGGIVYESLLEDVDTAKPVRVLLVENWLVYTYVVRSADEGVSTRVVTVELFEPVEETIDTTSSSKKRSKVAQAWSGLTGNFSSFTGDSSVSAVRRVGDAAAATIPVAYSQTYLFQGGVIQALGSTTTKFGISLKNLLVATDRETIVSIPRKVLDPRRPLGKPTKSEQEEYLVPYSPLIPNDPKWVLSHVYPAAQIRALTSKPALLESTSLVYAHGLDTFFTRTAPSSQFDLLSESFNKQQLLFTIALLSIGIFITRPLVKNRALASRW